MHGLVGLHEFDAQKNHEVNEFRTKMRAFCEDKAQERQLLPWYQWMEYNFPCDLEPISVVAQCAKSRGTKKIFINVKFEASEVSWWSPLKPLPVQIRMTCMNIKEHDRSYFCYIDFTSNDGLHHVYEDAFRCYF